MRNFYTKLLSLVVLLTLSFSTAFAQEKIKVSGIVTSDVDGFPLIGATVQVADNPSLGVVTNLDGEYTIKVNKGQKITFSYIGLKSRSVVADQAFINITLKADDIMLDEVVAIGYGVAKKKEVTGANIQVKSEDLNNVVSTDMGMALQGLVSGVSISSSAGDPGSVANIQIRGVTSISGSNTPLFVVDGIPQEGNPNIPSSEIQTIDILKDAASCAIYGTRGAAGVILITTKQGKEGKMRFALEGIFGGQQIAYDRLPEVMNTEEQTYVEILRARLYDMADMSANYALKKNPFYYMNNTDVMDMILNDGISPEQQYNLSMSGGGKYLTYSGVLGVHLQDGIVQNSGYERYSMRNNISYHKDRVRIVAGASFSMDRLQKASGTSLGQSLNFLPYTPELDRDDYEFTVPGEGFSPEVSAVSQLLRSFQSKNETHRNNFAGNIGFDYEISKAWSFTSKLGASLNNTYGERFTPNATVYDSNGDIVSKGSTTSSVENESTRRLALNGYAGINYNQTFNEKHKVTVSGIASYEKYDFKGFLAGRYNVINNDNFVLNNGTERPYAESKAYYTNHLFGLVGRVNYVFDGKYIISSSLRADASSKFSSSNRWGFFPSFSAGWNISEEGFWDGIENTVNNFRLRASYGTTGNENFSPYTYMSVLQNGLDYAGLHGTNYGSAMVTYANPDVKWETSAQTNIGFDLAFLNNSITLSGDVYQTNKKDMLATVKLPASTGATGPDALVTKNIGNMENKGLELNIGYKKVFKDFSLNTNLNISRSINEITELGNSKIMYNSNSTIISGDPNSVSTVFAEGYEAGAFFLYTTNGVANTAEELAAYKKLKPDARMGDLIFEDNNGDGQITSDDRTYCGSGLPEVELGWNLNLGYKNWSLTTNWFASIGNEILNGAQALSFSEGRNKLLVSQWSEVNTSSEIPAYYGDSKTHTNYIGNSDLWMEDGSFLRLKAVTLSYSLPKKATTKIKCENVRFYVSGQNLWTLTSYTGMDPEVGGNGLTTRGVDKGGYPVSKKYMLGVKIDF